MRILFLLAALALAACAATPYQPMSRNGGVEAQQIDRQTFRISARGNNRTAPSTISDYVLLKASEEAIRLGYAGFRIISSEDKSRTRHAVFMVTENIGTTSPVTKPAMNTLVRFLTDSELGNDPNAFKARNVWNNLAPRYTKARP